MKGKVYKITNKVNEKVYIGQTTSSLNRRFQNHTYSMKNPKFEGYPLYRAMNKYGIENFSIELLEEVGVEQLNEKETEYIKAYNSYSNGYNATLGGGGWRTNSLDEEKVIKKYNEIHHIGKTAEYFDSSYFKIKNILDNNKIEIIYPKESSHRANRISIKELQLVFNSGRDCAKYLIENNLCKTNKSECATTGISRSLNSGKKYCGLTFELHQ